MKIFKKGITIREMSYISIVAAIYVALTFGLAFMSYGAIQFRVSEILNLFVFIDPLFAPGIVLGCFISNLFSPLGWPDVVFGTFATLLTVIMIAKSRNLFVATLWPIICNIIVGVELHYVLNYPLFITILQVCFGEFVVVTVVGYPLFRAFMKNQKLVQRFRISKKEF